MNETRAEKKRAYFAAYAKAHPDTYRHASVQAAAARQSAIAMLKLEAGCTDCGYDANPTALEFDHVRGTKSANVSALRGSAGLERILDEIEKCEVVCANCHRIRTATRQHV